MQKTKPIFSMILLALGCCMTSNLYAQTPELDSAKTVTRQMKDDTTKAFQLGHLSYLIRYHNIDSATVYANMGTALSKALNYNKGFLYASASRVNLLSGTGQMDAMRQLVDSLINFMEEENSYHYANYLYTNLANSYHQEGNMPKAITYQETALKYAVEQKDSSDIISRLSGLGGFYAEMGDFENSKKYTKEACDMAEDIGDEWRLANGLIRLTELESDSTLKRTYISKALGLSEKINNAWLKAFSNYAFANLLLNVEDKPEESLTYYQKSYAIAKQINDAFFLSYVPNLLSNAFLATNELDSAEYYGKKAVQMAYSAKDIHVTESGLKSLSFILAQNKQYQEAYDSLEVAYLLKDSIFTLTNANQLAEANVKYETEKKDAEIAKNELEIAKKDAQRNTLIGSGLVILLLAGGLFLYLNERQKRKKKEAELALVEKEKEAEKLKELDDLKTQFFTNVSHELRTPLTLILGPLSDIMGEIKESKVKKAIHLAHSNADRLLDMINEVLDLSKLESGNIPIQWDTIQLKSYINRIVFAFESLAEIRNIQLVLHTDDIDYQVKIDSQKVEKIINNLISNALKYSEKDSEIIINAKVNNGQFTVSVQDFGKGIDPGEREKIFNRFYQSNVVTAVEGGGTGVGLALSKELAHLMEGSLDVESELGKGSMFTLKLPIEVLTSLSSTSEIAKSKSDAQIYEPILINGEKPHVLIIEDHPEMRQYLSEILSEEYRCSFAPDGYEALKMLQTKNFDIVSSDIMMPNMDGFTLKEKINELNLNKQTPFIFLSARSLEEDKIAGLRLGVDDYITKPFNKSEYIARIRNLLNNKLERLASIQSSDSDLTEDRSIEESILRDAEKSILKNITNSNYKVSDLANDLNYSQRQITRIMKQLTGMTPVNFILEMRLQRAYRILQRKSKHNVSEVMYEVGIESASYFARKFKERFGISPGEM